MIQAFKMDHVRHIRGDESVMADVMGEWIEIPSGSHPLYNTLHCLPSCLVEARKMRRDRCVLVCPPCDFAGDTLKRKRSGCFGKFVPAGDVFGRGFYIFRLWPFALKPLLYSCFRG